MMTTADMSISVRSTDYLLVDLTQIDFPGKPDKHRSVHVISGCWIVHRVDQMTLVTNLDDSDKKNIRFNPQVSWVCTKSLSLACFILLYVYNLLICLNFSAVGAPNWYPMDTNCSEVNFIPYSEKINLTCSSKCGVDYNTFLCQI